MEEMKETKQATPRRSSAAKDSGTAASAQAGSTEAIARRAHELFQARGGLHGYDIDDWLEAERQIHAMTTGKPRRASRVARRPSAG